MDLIIVDITIKTISNEIDQIYNNINKIFVSDNFKIRNFFNDYYNEDITLENIFYHLKIAIMFNLFGPIDENIKYYLESLEGSNIYNLIYFSIHVDILRYFININVDPCIKNHMDSIVNIYGLDISHAIFIKDKINKTLALIKDKIIIN